MGAMLMTKQTGLIGCALGTVMCAEDNCGGSYYGGGGGAGTAGDGINGGTGVQTNVTGTLTYHAGGGAGRQVCDGPLGTQGPGTGQLRRRRNQRGFAATTVF